MSKTPKNTERPETKVEQAEKPAETINPGKERPETVVKEAESPAKTLTEGEVRPETPVEEAEQPAKVAAVNNFSEGSNTPTLTPAKGTVPEVQVLGKVLHLSKGVSIPVVAVTNPHFGITGEKRVSVTVPVENEDGSTEGLLLHDIPERLIK
jgi:hypothetical protein